MRSRKISALSILVTAKNLAVDILRALDRKRKPGPLFVPFGENHQLGAHVILPITVMKELLNRGLKLAFGYENSYNYLSRSFQSYGRRAWLLNGTHTRESVEKASIEIEDSDGVRAVNAILRDGSLFKAPLSSLVRFRFLREHSIPVHFNDAAKIQIGYKSYAIDLEDPLTGNLTSGISGPHLPVIRVESAKGLYKRNRVSTHLARAHGLATGADIYIEHAGNTHVGGNAFKKRPGTQSLVSLFRQQGHDAHGIRVLYSGYEGYPPLHIQRFLSTVYLDSPEFIGRVVEVQTREKRWLEAVLPVLGLEDMLEGLEVFEAESIAAGENLFASIMRSIRLEAPAI